MSGRGTKRIPIEILTTDMRRFVTGAISGTGNTMTETITWHGKYCSNCEAAFTGTPENYVAGYEFCPYCGECSTLHTKEVEKPLGEPVAEYL